MFFKVKLRGARANMAILAVTPSLVVTEDWGRLISSDVGWLEPKGQAGYLCQQCFKVMRDKAFFEAFVIRDFLSLIFHGAEIQYTLNKLLVHNDILILLIPVDPCYINTNCYNTINL